MQSKRNAKDKKTGMITTILKSYTYGEDALPEKQEEKADGCDVSVVWA
ncbi:hypothetical protein [Fervidobacterium sp.]